MILIILLFSIFSCTYADDSSNLFMKANELYKTGDYEKAMSLYDQIEDKSEYTNYNLGNCAYKLQKYGLALLYWRRAEKEWGLFNRRELVENITLLKETDTKRGPIILTAIKLTNLISSLIRSIPLIILQIIFLLLWFFIFFYLRFLYKKRKNYIIISLFALIALFGILLITRYIFESRSYGVVVSKETQLRSGPAESFQELLTLPEAQEVVIKKESGDYYKIKALKRIGWVRKIDIKEI